jgi:hypothetical protein
MFFGLNDVAFLAAASAAAGPGFDFLDPANIGQPVEGGFFAGLISHTADGNPTHALIVAPRATGATGTGYTLTTNLAWKTANTTTVGATSSFDGVANTAAMVTAGIAEHPAAQFCVNLTIGGYADWYLPSRYELDIAYFNLKPTTSANGTTSPGPNAYSVPVRSLFYTATYPAQTFIEAFNTSAESFVANRHWSSVDVNASTAGDVSFADGTYRTGSGASKVTAFVVRAFRRIAL